MLSAQRLPEIGKSGSNDRYKKAYGSLGNQHNEQEQREPPPPPTPLEFPRLGVRSTDPSVLSKDEVTKLFSLIPRNGPGINYMRCVIPDTLLWGPTRAVNFVVELLVSGDKYFLWFNGYPNMEMLTRVGSALNVQVAHDVELDQLLPEGYLPPSAWLEENTPASGTDDSSAVGKFLSNGAPTPDRAVFQVRAKELLIDNEAAFAFLQRKQQASAGPPIRIAHFRKFWEHLLGMAAFWDTSLDKYITTRDTHRVSLRSVSRSALRNLSRSPFRKRSRSPKDRRAQLSPPESPDRETFYTGRRISSGANMPAQLREDAVCAFVRVVAWAFRCSVDRPKIEPKLQMGGVTVPIVQTASVYRTPKDSQKARKGVVEGPLMAIQCRNLHSFRKDGEDEGEARGEVLDMLRETGLALMVAQKRMREGTEEYTTWKGKWWVEEKRWGGGTGMQISVIEAASQPKSTRPGEDITRVPEKYIKLHPPTSTWDKNVTYMQIGKDRSAQYDDIYIVSSLNHHISILRFLVAQQYTEFITNLYAHEPATSPTGESLAQPRSLLSVQRSRWYDLLNVEDRAEAMRGIWGVMGWLMRDTDSRKEDVQMGGTEA